MEKVEALIEQVTGPRDKYTTGGRTLAFLLAAIAIFVIERKLGGLNPWVIGLFVAGLLNLFALIFNAARARMDEAVTSLKECRKRLEEVLTSLENYLDNAAADMSRPDALAASRISMARSSSSLKQLNMETLPLLGRKDGKADLKPVRLAVQDRIIQCDDRVAALTNRPSWWGRFFQWWIAPHRWWRRFSRWLSQGGSFTLRSGAPPV